MIVHTVRRVEKSVAGSTNRSYTSAMEADTDDEEAPNPSKRKRYENDSMDTPFRPVESVPSATSNLKENNNWYVESIQLNPVAIPESVVELFRRPHVFPNDSYHELLKASGVRPKVYFKTTGNTAAFSRDAEITPDFIAKKLQKKAKRSSLDNQVQQSEENVITGDPPISSKSCVWSKGKEVTIFEKPNGTYVVRVHKQRIEFPQVFINLQQLRVPSDQRNDS